MHTEAGDFSPRSEDWDESSILTKPVQITRSRSQNVPVGGRRPVSRKLRRYFVDTPSQNHSCSRIDRRTAVMIETSQSLARLAALIAVTAGFALLWANDQPDAQLAMKTGPVFQPLAGQPLPAESRSRTSRSRTSSVAPRPTAAAIAPVREVMLGGVAKSFAVEAEGLAISSESLTEHLDQLPLGLAAGDYRIVDPLGGVGWLRIRETPAESRTSRGSEVVTTSAAGGDVRFIRVRVEAVSGR